MKSNNRTQTREAHTYPKINTQIVYKISSPKRENILKLNPNLG